MTDVPSKLQTLYIWRLLASGGGKLLKDFKPDFKPKERKPLIAAGLIVEQGRPLHISLTEKGWQWAEEHLDAEVSERSTTAGPILRAILTKLKAHLARHRIALADFICEAESAPALGGSDKTIVPLPPTPLRAPTEGRSGERGVLADARGKSSDHASHTPSHDGASLAAAVRHAYFQVSGGRPNVRVRLNDLRAVLASLPRDRLDAQLLAMERQRSVILYPLDDPQEISPPDRAAALANSAGLPRHVMYIER